MSNDTQHLIGISTEITKYPTIKYHVSYIIHNFAKEIAILKLIFSQVYVYINIKNCPLFEFILNTLDIIRRLKLIIDN